MSQHYDDGPSVGRVALYSIIAFLVAVTLGIGGWAFKVATADVKGRGDASIKKASASNRIAAQEDFEKRYADIVATDRKLDVYAAALERTPGDATAQANLDGTTAYCLSAVGDYNADARSYTREAFRAIDLPAQIDSLDPTTDCEPTK